MPATYTWTVQVTQQTAAGAHATPHGAITAAITKLGITDPSAIIHVEATRSDGFKYGGAPA